jgi:hypothetical protein
MQGSWQYFKIRLAHTRGKKSSRQKSVTSSQWKLTVVNRRYLSVGGAI